jgi:hypothetical protein
MTSARPDKPKNHAIKVTVTFPIAPGGPFHADEPPDTTIKTLRDAAMAQFGIAEDGQHAYYLTHGGTRVSDGQTVGEIAGHAKAVKFTLVKELIQG